MRRTNVQFLVSFVPGLAVGAASAMALRSAQKVTYRTHRVAALLSGPDGGLASFWTFRRPSPLEV
jgi:hypothetical protein